MLRDVVGGQDGRAEVGRCGVGAVAQAQELDMGDAADPVLRGLRRPDAGIGVQRGDVVGAHAGRPHDDDVARVGVCGGEAADHGAVAVAEEGGVREAGRVQTVGEPAEALGTGLGEPARRLVEADARGGGVTGPGDDGRVVARLLLEVGGPLCRTVERRDVDVRTGDDHRDVGGVLQIPHDLRDQPATTRVVRENLLAGGGVGLVPELHGGAVEVAHHGGMLLDEPLPLSTGEPAEEGRDVGRGGRARVRQLPAQRVVRQPRGGPGKRPTGHGNAARRGPTGRTADQQRGQYGGAEDLPEATHPSVSLCLVGGDGEEGRKPAGSGASRWGAKSEVIPR